MAISLIVIGAIIAGATLSVGGISLAGIYSTNNEALVREKLSEVNNQIKNCGTIINNLKNLKSEVSSVLSYINESQSFLANGGHCQDGKSLPNSEYETCKDNLESASGGIDDTIAFYEDELENLKEMKIKLEERLKQIQVAKRREQLAFRKQHQNRGSSRTSYNKSNYRNYR